MSNNEHPTAGDPHRTFRCTFGPVREKDLVWPPPDHELDACEVVHLDAGTDVSHDPDALVVVGPRTTGAADAPVEAVAAGAKETGGETPAAEGQAIAGDGGAAEVAAHETPRRAAEPVVTIPKIAAIKPARTIKPTFGDCRAPGRAPRIRPMVVPMVPPPPADVAQAMAAAPDAPPEPPPESARHAEFTSLETVADPVPTVEPSAELEIAHLAAADPENTIASRSAWLALFFAAACLALAVFEYREIFSPPAEAGLAMAEAPPMPENISTADLAPDAARRGAAVPAVSQTPAPIVAAPPTPEEIAIAPARPLEPKPTVTAPPSRAVATQVAAALAPRPEPAPKQVAAPSAPRPEPAPKQVLTVPAPRIAAAGPAASVTPPPVARTPERPAATPLEPRPTGRPAPIPAPVVAVRSGAPAAATSPATPSPEPSAITAARTPNPAPAPTPDPSPAVAETPARTAALSDANTDEADIRSTLTRFRAAYSQLNASAARDVWPTVDARALERAFQSLKSQELRFESCNLRVTGARAQAACKGRAVYVPRIGDQSPRLTDREWTFELRKADERWTIASARTL